MFNWYALETDKGFAGMKADVTVDVIDSFSSEDGINPGEPVIRGTDPAKQVKTAAVGDVNKIIGIAIHTHKDLPISGKYYEEGYCLPVMTFGDVYVVAGGDVKAGDGVGLSTNDDGEIVYVKAAASGGIEGFTFLDNAGEGELVRVRIRK